MYPAPAPKHSEDMRVNLAIFVILILALSFVLVHFNIVSCGFYSRYGCDVYYGIVAGGKPRTLIVHGNSGMGEPESLYEVLQGPRIGARVSIRGLDTTSLRFLQDYQLVIVEKADKMSIEEIKMFQEYVTRGGRLVWIGDAGSIAPESESDVNYFLKNSDRKAGATDGLIGPWARRNGNNQVSLDYFLGTEFVGNHCKLAEKCDENKVIGFFEFPSQSERLANGLTQGLALYGDFSIVKLNDSGYQKAVGFLNYGPDFIATAPKDYFWLKSERQNFGKSFPVIVLSGVGGRVAYYAFAPEYVVGDKMPIERTSGQRVAYWGMIENMYYGMLYK